HLPRSGVARKDLAQAALLGGDALDVAGAEARHEAPAVALEVGDDDLADVVVPVLGRVALDARGADPFVERVDVVDPHERIALGSVADLVPPPRTAAVEPALGVADVDLGLANGAVLV